MIRCCALVPPVRARQRRLRRALSADLESALAAHGVLSVRPESPIPRLAVAVIPVSSDGHAGRTKGDSIRAARSPVAGGIPLFTAGREIDRLELGDSEDGPQPDRLALLREAAEAQGAVLRLLRSGDLARLLDDEDRGRPVREVAEVWEVLCGRLLRLAARRASASPRGRGRLSKLLQQTHGAGETDRIESDPSTTP